jgi:gliding motility-associated protein GldM
MASGKETPRQKMINLMYLVFIAMLALNMSKEVLTTFGEIDAKVGKSTTNIKAKNTSDLDNLKKDAENDASNWAEAYDMVNQISVLANELDTYVNNEVKFPVVMKEDRYDRNGDGNTKDLIPDYEVMDNAKEYDELFFKGDKFTSTGDSLVMYIDKFREESIVALDSLKAGIQPESVKDEIKALITEKFSTDNVIDGKGIERPWLKYNFEHFPQIASTTKLTLMQENAQNIVARLIAAIRGETLTEITKANKQTAFAQGVDVFFTGQKLDGKVVLGKYDDNLFANRVTINGKEYPGPEVMEGGQVNLEKLGINVGGSPGEKSLKVKFEFDRFENKVDTTYVVEMDHKYAVVPSLANISNPDMYVVYKDLENTLNISMAGVADNKLQILNPKTLTKKSDGVYIMKGEKGKKNKAGDNVVDIVVGVKGESVTSTVQFEVLKIPDPIASFNGKPKVTRSSRKRIATSRIQASFADPKLAKALKLDIESFVVKIGTAQKKVTGSSSFPKSIRDAIVKNARKNSIITIKDIVCTSKKYPKKNFLPLPISMEVVD